MLPGTIIYISIASASFLYILISTVVFFWFYGSLSATYTPTMATLKRKGLLMKHETQSPWKRLKNFMHSALKDRNSELSRRSACLLALQSFSSVVLISIYSLYESATIHGEWEFSCLAMSILSYLSWPLFVFSYTTRVIRVRLLVSQSRLRRMGALILSDNSEDSSGGFGVTSSHAPGGEFVHNFDAGINETEDNTGNSSKNDLSEIPKETPEENLDQKEIICKNITHEPSDNLQRGKSNATLSSSNNMEKADSVYENFGPGNEYLKMYQNQEQSSLIKKLNRLEYWSDELRLIIISISASVFFTSLNFLISIPFQWYKPGSQSGCEFTPSSILVLAIVGVFAFIGLPTLLLVIRGCTDVYHLSENIRVTVVVAQIFYLIFGALFIFFSRNPIISRYFPAWNVASIALLIIQTFTVVVPLFQDRHNRHYSTINRARRKLNQEMTASGIRPAHAAAHIMSSSSIPSEEIMTQSLFQQMLLCQPLYEKLRGLAIEEFSTENPMFWESYLSWMHHCLGAIISYEGKAFNISGEHSEMSSTIDEVYKDKVIYSLTEGVIPSLSSLKAELAKQNSGNLLKHFSSMKYAQPVARHSVVLPGDGTKLDRKSSLDIPMSFTIGRSLIGIYRRFIVINSPFELNIQDRQRNDVGSIVKKLEKKIEKMFINPTDDNGKKLVTRSSGTSLEKRRGSLWNPISNPKLPKKPNLKYIDGVYLRFSGFADEEHHKANSDHTKQDLLVIPVNILDEIKVTVLESMFMNTFSRYVSKRSTSRHDLAEG